MYSALTTEPQWIFQNAIYDFGYEFMDYYFTKTFKCLDTKSFKCMFRVYPNFSWMNWIGFLFDLT